MRQERSLPTLIQRVESKGAQKAIEGTYTVRADV